MVRHQTFSDQIHWLSEQLWFWSDKTSKQQFEFNYRFNTQRDVAAGACCINVWLCQHNLGIPGCGFDENNAGIIECSQA